MEISTKMKTLTIVASLMFTANVNAAENQDTTVVVPETGYLAIKPSRNFTGPNNVIVCSCLGSPSSGLSFTKYRLDTVVVASTTNSSSGMFLVAKPGTYTLTLTDTKETRSFYSTSVYWKYDAGQVYKKNRNLYKFINEPGRVGFERDEKYAADNYQYCDLAEGEHAYLSLAASNVTKAAELLSTTAAELKFIPFDTTWRNAPMPDETATTGISKIGNDTQADAACYDLTGRRVKQTKKGLYIQNGNKLILK